MASLGHLAVGVAAARISRHDLPEGRVPLTSMLAWSALSFLPDADVIGFQFGVRYADEWGHRGATHSMAHTRYFFPWTPIPVSPIGLGFLSPYGMFVALVELVLFSPLFWFGLRSKIADGGLRPD